MVTGCQDTPPKSAKDEYTKLCQLIARDLRKEKKVILKLLFLIRIQVLRNNLRALSIKEKLRESNWFWVHCLAWHARISANYQYTKFFQLSEETIREVTLSDSKVSFNQESKSTFEQTKSTKKLDSNCSLWQWTLQNLFRFNI